MSTLVNITEYYTTSLCVKLHAFKLRPFSNTASELISSAQYVSFLKKLHVHVTRDLYVYTAKYAEKI